MSTSSDDSSKGRMSEFSKMGLPRQFSSKRDSYRPYNTWNSHGSYDDTPQTKYDMMTKSEREEEQRLIQSGLKQVTENLENLITVRHRKGPPSQNLPDKYLCGGRTLGIL